MNVTILALGSRGDVQPAIAIGVGLRAAGYTVRLASYTTFEELATSHGLTFQKIEGDITAMLHSTGGQEALESGNPFKLVRMMRTSIHETYDQATTDVVSACADAEMIVSVGPIILAAVSVAEAMDVPIFQINLQPLLGSGAFSSPLLPVPPIRTRLINKVTHQIFEQLFWQLLRPEVNRARREIYGQAPMPLFNPLTRAVNKGMVSLFAYSKHIIPKPADWPSNTFVSGYLYLDGAAVWQPPADLEAFLAAGPPPVYVGFGSMSTRDPQATADLVIAALQQSGQRGILLTGWGGLRPATLSEDIMVIDSAPHDWLFPQMAAVVHHGGAGTTAAGLRAGVPSILIPFFADQPFWGFHVHKQGVSPRPIHRDKLTVEGLAVAIHTATTDSAMRQRAAELGSQIEAENGVGQAIALIEHHLNNGYTSFYEHHTPAQRRESSVDNFTR